MYKKIIKSFLFTMIYCIATNIFAMENSHKSDTSKLEVEQVLKILHLSDTHGFHRDIEKCDSMPQADILLHTGDFTNKGSLEEMEDFDLWLEEVAPRFRLGIFVILGNHEWKWLSKEGLDKNNSLNDHIVSLKKILKHGHLLHDELMEVGGLKIFGSGWAPWSSAYNPDKLLKDEIMKELNRKNGEGKANSFDKIPFGVDILMTHGPSEGIFDKMEGTKNSWGSSSDLKNRIILTQPKAHLFGHVHEQRGLWIKSSGESHYDGGVEYSYFNDGEVLEEFQSDAPHSNYPCQLISSNAMLNHSRFEQKEAMIVGRPRVIIAKKNGPGEEWFFECPIKAK